MSEIICKKHPHSSIETAKKCWEKTLRKQGDRKIKRALQTWRPSYIQIKNKPPRIVNVSGVDVYIFYESSNKIKF